jgi:hypothetical protein
MRGREKRDGGIEKNRHKLEGEKLQTGEKKDREMEHRGCTERKKDRTRN